MSETEEKLRITASSLRLIEIAGEEALQKGWKVKKPIHRQWFGLGNYCVEFEKPKHKTDPPSS